ncbi:hypothetical protein FNT36_03105 [Hymenobacter setariae]|uniref:Bacteriophage T4 Gp32 single-stranded DNA-binding domain-containing protein n=1 Tax=Hymenobacter setariae TaxID=2594794 RepID=A0A558C305_9BACT|nr:hypothetical protein [Hymenobacter setariae]TVT43094.1 hypothetical protein FNT36_03105 [Hymenobacter setariae]
MSSAFIPETYVAPVSGGDYTKLQDGTTSLRILSEQPLFGWVYWNTANKPVRFEFAKHPGQPSDARIGADGKPDAVKEFWAMAVYNITNKKVELWEVTQAQIKNALTALAKDAEWGHPTQYSIKVSKSGTGKDTKYGVLPTAPKPLPAEIQAEVDAKPVNLRALIDGGNPFDSQPKPGAAPTPEQAKNLAPTDDNDLPF